MIGPGEVRAHTARAWALVLGGEPDEQQNFFAAGGDSVDAARLSRTLEAALGRTISLRTIFDHPTFVDLVVHLSAPASGSSSVPQRREAAAGDRHPLTPRQRLLWLHHRAHPTSARYHVVTVVDVRGELDRAALEEAVTAVVRRHEPLRTLVRDTGRLRSGLPVPEALVMPPDVRTPLLHRAVAGPSAADDVVDAWTAEPMDLAKEPPVRMGLVDLGRDRSWIVVVVHHIATDARSQEIVVDDLLRHYAHVLDGAAPEMPPVPATFRDLLPSPPVGVAAAAAPVVAEGRSGAAAAAPATIGDASRTGSSRETGRLGVDAWDGVRAVAAAAAVTPFAVLLAVLGEILARQSGHDRLVVGCPVSVREGTLAESTVGFLVDTHELEIDTAGAPTLGGLATRVAEEARTVRAARSSQGADAEVGAPSFRVWFNHLGIATRPRPVPRLVLSYREPRRPPALFLLNVYVTEVDGDLEVALVHEHALVSSVEARELLEQYLVLTRRAVVDPDRALRDVLVSTTLSSTLPDPAEDLPGTSARSLTDAWQELLSDPDRPALRCGGVQLARGELESEISRCADALRRAGAAPGDVVAVQVTRGPTLVIAIRAVHHLGADVLVLDPAHPTARREELLAAAAACLLVGEVGAVGSDAVPTLGVRQLHHPVRRRPDRTDHPVQVTFTSGSTGTPVGVRSPARALEHFLDWYATLFRIDSDDRVSVLSGLGHDPLMRDVWLGAWTGAVTCIPSAAQMLDPRETVAWLAEERVSIVHLTPPRARLLATTDAALPDVRLVVLGGAELTRADVASLRRLMPRATVVNGYGSTETPQLAALAVAVERVDARPSIGRGAPGTQVLITDHRGRMCEIGRPGEIVVRSRNLVEPVDVAGRAVPGFRPDVVSGIRRLATGDQGRYRADGTVEFLGRSSSLVEIRGHRVHPAEVDRAVLTAPGVVSSTTLVRDGRDGPTLTTYVVGDTVLDDARVRGVVAARLPAAMVPEVVVQVDRVPLTANGKVDEDRLRTLLPRSERTSPVVAPSSDLEARLRDLVAGQLGTAGFASSDQLFDLGATSLAMLRLHAAIRRELAPDLTLVELYRHPSVSGLVDHLSAAASTVHVGRGRATDAAAQRARRRHARESWRDGG